MAYVQSNISQDNLPVSQTQPSRLFASYVKHTTNATLTDSDLGYMWGDGGGGAVSNEGAAGRVDLTLPTGVAAGRSLCFWNTAAQDFYLHCGGSDTMTGGAGAGRVGVVNGVEGVWIWVHSIGGGQWVAMNFGAATFF